MGERFPEDTLPLIPLDFPFLVSSSTSESAVSSYLLEETSSQTCIFVFIPLAQWKAMLSSLFLQLP